MKNKMNKILSVVLSLALIMGMASDYMYAMEGKQDSNQVVEQVETPDGPKDVYPEQEEQQNTSPENKEVNADLVINDKTGLETFRTNVNGGTTYEGKTVELNANIDMAGTTWTEGIGRDYTLSFKGTFNGNNHTISNLTINNNTKDYLGLFGSIETGSIKDLGLEGISVTGKEYVGGLVGANLGTITNSYVTGTVTGTDRVGGLVGANYETITRSYATVTVTGNSSVGGLAGSSEDKISRSYATGKVTGTTDVGGLLGRVTSGPGEPSYCYYDKETTGQGGKGTGLESWQMFGESAKANMPELFETGSPWKTKLRGTENKAFYPYLTESNIPEYSLTKPINVTTSTGGKVVAKIGEQEIKHTTVNEKIELVPTADSGYQVDWIKVADETVTPTGGKYVYTVIEGKDVNVTYNFVKVITEINTVADLIAFRDSVNVGNTYEGKTITLNVDIDMTGETWTEGIGRDYTLRFKGTFNGNNHTISNLTINNNTKDYLGLFGSTEGSINDLGVEGISVTGKSEVGGLVGANLGTITNSYVTGTVTGTDRVGGLVGANYETITRSYATVTVTGNSSVGGLAGSSEDKISRSYATGKVTGTTDVGGLLGRVTSGPGEPSYCYYDKETTGQGGKGTGLESWQMFGESAKANMPELFETDSPWKTKLRETGNKAFYPYLTESNIPEYSLTKPINVTTSTGGKVVAKIGEQEIKHTAVNEKIELVPTLDAGYVVDWIKVADETVTPTGGKYVYTVKEGKDVNVTYSFEQIITEITNKADLIKFRDMVNGGTSYEGKTVTLNADIDMTGETWTEGIGREYTLSFKGTFNGNNKKISNLTINDNTKDDLGLFGRIETGSINNLGVEGISVTGKEYVGGLVGVNKGTITNSYVTGTVSGTGQVGGLLGMNQETITRSYATGTVTGTVHVGGLVGINGDRVTITNSYAIGKVTGTSNVGGLVGRNISGSNSVTITNSYYDKETTTQATSDGGTGLESWQMFGESAKSNMPGFFETDSPWKTKLRETGNKAFYPYLTDKNIPEYSLTKPINVTTSTGGTLVAKVGEQEVKHTTVKETIELVPTVNRLYEIEWIKVADEAVTPTEGKYVYTVKEGKDVNVTYSFVREALITEISNKDDLIKFRDMVNEGGDYTGKTVTLNVDIDMTGETWTEGIGTVVSTNVFKGKFNGNNHKISNLTINNNSVSLLGLFGVIKTGSQINDLGVEGISVTGGSNVGGLVGWNNGGTITNSYAKGTVSGTSTYVGGLVGKNDIKGTITNSYATGTVTGAGYVGGLVGASAGSIENSYATGAATGTATETSGQSVGGLSGSNASVGTITNSYATGTVTGKDYVGGLVGTNQGTITNSYATGKVTGGTSVGGLIGHSSAGTITNSYYDKETTGQSDTGKGTGLESWQMFGDSAKTYMTGFFETGSPWKTKLRGTENKAFYPYLNESNIPEYSLAKPITVTSATGGKVVAKVGEQEVKHTAVKETIELVPTLNAGYSIDWIKVADETVTPTGGKYVYTVVEGKDVNVTYSFVKESTITYTQVSNGTISGKDKAITGEEVTLTVTPNAGYQTKKISYNGTEITAAGGVYKFTMPGENVAVTGEFEEKEYNITYTQVSNGTISGKNKAKIGEEVTLTATPNAGYQTKKISFNGTEITAVGGVYKFTMSEEDVIVTGEFEAKEYNITYTQASNGAISGKNKARTGEEVTLTATPNTGYQTKKISYNGTEITAVDGVYKFTMPAVNVAVTGEFEEKEYNITYTQVSNGTISGKNKAKTGEEVTVTATPSAGYQTKKISYNGIEITAVGGVYKFTMPEEDVIVTGEFEAKEYNITYTQASNGAISGKNKARTGEEVTLTATPNAGYQAKKISYNGTEITAVGGVYKFTMPAANVEVTGEFEPIPTPDPTPDPSPTPDDKDTGGKDGGSAKTNDPIGLGVLGIIALSGLAMLAKKKRK